MLDVSADELGAGHALYEADGAPVRLPEDPELSVNRDPGVRVFEDPVVSPPIP